MIFEVIYWIISAFICYCVIYPISFIINLIYLIRLNKYVKQAKINLKDMCDLVTSIDSAIDMMNVIIPKYFYDPFFGILNWFSFPFVTYLRSFYLVNEKHSKDCSEYARVLAYLIRNSILKRDYKKVKIITILSLKPLVRYNHTIVLAIKYDNTIDLFSPYQYLGNYRQITDCIDKLEDYNKVVYSNIYLDVF